MPSSDTCVMVICLGTRRECSDPSKFVKRQFGILHPPRLLIGVTGPLEHCCLDLYPDSNSAQLLLTVVWLLKRLRVVWIFVVLY